MRCHWWLAEWARARAGTPSAVHFVRRATPLAHYAMLAKRAGSHYAQTLLSVELEPPRRLSTGPVAPGLASELANGSARPVERFEWLVAPAQSLASAPAPLMALDALAESCMRAQAQRHADVCVAADSAVLRAAAHARACMGAYELQPLFGADGATATGAAQLWAARLGSRALAAALDRGEALASRERVLGSAGRDKAAVAAAEGSAVAGGATDGGGDAAQHADRARGRDLPSAPVLSVCIVSHNRGALLLQAVSAVRAQLGVARAAALLRSATGDGGGRGGFVRNGGDSAWSAERRPRRRRLGAALGEAGEGGGAAAAVSGMASRMGGGGGAAAAAAASAAAAAREPSDVELLVVDDASTEPDTLRILSSLAASAAADADEAAALAAPSAGAAAAAGDADGVGAPGRPAGAQGQVVWPLRVHRLASNGYLGAARNAAARLSRGVWLFFVDDDNVAKPHMLLAFARAAARSGASVLTCVNHKWPSAEQPPQPEAEALFDPVTGDLREGALDGWADGAAAGSAERTTGQHWLPLGPCAELGAHANCFGDAHVLIRREAFEAVGGYTTDFGLGLEDWELYARLTLRAGADAEAALRKQGARAREGARGAGGAAGGGAAGGAGGEREAEAMLPVHHLVIPSPLYWYRLSRGGGMLARQHADSPEARAQRLADRLRSLRPYVERSWDRDGVAPPTDRTARAEAHAQHDWPRAGAASATPSLEALLLFSESLRPLDSGATAGECGAPAGALTWLPATATLTVALALALVLRRLVLGWRRVRPPYRLLDRSV